jgi:hypothetical protein
VNITARVNVVKSSDWVLSPLSQQMMCLMTSTKGHLLLCSQCMDSKLHAPILESQLPVAG